MNRADLSAVVRDEAAKHGWKLESISKRNCTAIIKSSSGLTVEPQWSSLSDEYAIRSCIRMFIQIEEQQFASGEQKDN